MSVLTEHVQNNGYTGISIIYQALLNTFFCSFDQAAEDTIYAGRQAHLFTHIFLNKGCGSSPRTSENLHK